MAVANQFLITIRKTPIVKGQGQSYLAILSKEWIAASKKLSPSAFQLFLYLADKQNGYENWELSKVAVTKTFGFSDKTYSRAVKELIEERYLVQVDGVKYDFFTVPLDKNVSLADRSEPQ